MCNGCAQGCNVDVHYVLDRPHLNDGARLLRVKPRFNADVNEWWMCDEGRYGFGWVDRERLTKVRNRGRDSTWAQAIPAIVSELAPIRKNGAGPRCGVIASTQLTNEELFLVREIFQAYANVPKDEKYFEENFKAIVDRLQTTHGFALEPDDASGIGYIYEFFGKYGPELTYWMSGGGGGRINLDHLAMLSGRRCHPSRWQERLFALPGLVQTLLFLEPGLDRQHP